MYGLILKDLFIMRKTISWMYLFPVIVIVLAGLQSPEALLFSLPLVVLFLSNSIVISTFAHDESSNWKKAVLSLPVSSLAVASSKMIEAIAVSLISGLVIGVSCYVVATAIGLSPMLPMFGVVTAIALIILYDTLLFPIIFKYGYSKNQLATFIFMGVILLLMYAVRTNLDAALTIVTGASVVFLSVVAILMLIILVGLSSIVSTRVIRADVK